MLTVAVIAQKGGVGKTTLALHLAVEAAKSGRVVIIDTDPQASAAQWADERHAPQPAVVTSPASRLAVSLHAARQSGAHIAFIDTAPAVESPALAAVRAARLLPDRITARYPRPAFDRHQCPDCQACRQAGRPRHQCSARERCAGPCGGRGCRHKVRRRGLPDHHSPACRVRARTRQKQVRAGGRARGEGRGRNCRALGLARAAHERRDVCGAAFSVAATSIPAASGLRGPSPTPCLPPTGI